MKNSTIKQKTGRCPECNNGNVVPLISGRCNNHYWKRRRAVNNLKSEVDLKEKKKGIYVIPKFSKKMAKNLSEYRKKRDAFMQLHTFCQYPACCRFATDLHHMKGRQGSLLNNERYFAALCREHHTYLEEHPKEAKELKLSFNRL